MVGFGEVTRQPPRSGIQAFDECSTSCPPSLLVLDANLPLQMMIMKLKIQKVMKRV